MKRIIASITLAVIISFKCFSQTYVSGGIFSNTTWTLANSPYIITDTIIVFQNVTLTIEPGVVVKFDDNKKLEIRQGILIANGTAADPITFTSNSPAPYPGIYYGTFIKNDSTLSQFNYCIVEYASLGLSANFQYVSGFTVKHCKFQFNINGIYAYSLNTSFLDSSEIKYNTGNGELGFFDVTNCNISNNRLGICDCHHITNCVIDSNLETGVSGNFYSVTNCLIRYDSIGIKGIYTIAINNCIFTNNKIGIQSETHTTTNCIIDSNLIGIDVVPSATGHINVSNCNIEYNGIGIQDPPYVIQGLINKFTNNIINNNSIGISLGNNDTISCNSICNNSTYGIKYSFHTNTSCAKNNYWCTTDSAIIETLIYDGYDFLGIGHIYFMPIDTSMCFLSSGISNNELQNFSFDIFPNPALEFLSIEQPANIYKSEIKIFNMLGEIVYSSTLTKNKTLLDISFLKNGLYMIQMISNNKIGRKNFIRQ